MNETELAAVLEAYDLGAVQDAEPLDCDPRRPWKVRTNRGVFVVRECHLYRSTENLEVEHRLASWLAGRGFPASCAVAARDGKTWVRRSGRLFAIHTYLPGEAHEPRNAEQAGSAGGCLARFHQLAGAWEGAHLRRPPVAYRTTEASVEEIGARWPESEGIGDLLREFASLDNALHHADLPETLLFNDFRAENMVFEMDEVSGLFDFECCFQGPRLRDVSCAVLAFALIISGQEGVEHVHIEFSVACAKELVRGYQAVGPLSQAERGLLPKALRRQIRRWAIHDALDAQQPGRWNDYEWNHSRRQIDAVDGACERVVEN